jgi:hypothetical protein
MHMLEKRQRVATPSCLATTAWPAQRCCRCDALLPPASHTGLETLEADAVHAVSLLYMCDCSAQPACWHMCLHTCPATASFVLLLVLLLVLLPCSLASAHVATSATWHTQCLVSGVLLSSRFQPVGSHSWLLLLLLPGGVTLLHCALRPYRVFACCCTAVSAHLQLLCGTPPCLTNACTKPPA